MSKEAKASKSRGGSDKIVEQRNTPEQVKQAREFESKLAEALNSHDALFAQGANAIHDAADEAKWFATNTPDPFKTSYIPPVVSFAAASCHHLQDLARRGNVRAIRELARLTVEMTELLDEMLCDSHAEVIQSNAATLRQIAAELPYWPMLYHRHAAPKKHFERIADLLHLGEACPVNVSKSAKYMMQTPINRVVWKLLSELETLRRVHATIGQKLLADQKSKFTASLWLCGVHRKEDAEKIFRICKRSHRLKPLAKSTAQQWADIAVMPLLRVYFHDFQAEPVFKTILERRNPKSQKAAVTTIRKAVIQSLRSLAAKRLDKTNRS